MNAAVDEGVLPTEIVLFTFSLLLYILTLLLLM